MIITNVENQPLVLNNVTPELLRKTSSWILLSDNYTTTMLAKFKNNNETTSIAFRLAKEKFNIADKDFREMADGDEGLIRQLTIEVLKSGKPKSKAKARHR